MKKRLTNIAIVGLCLTVLVGCKKPIPQEEKVELNIPSNIVVRAEENGVAYYTIENTTLRKVDLNVPGEVRGFNEEENIVIYSSFDTANYSTTLTITDGVEEKSLNVDGFVENLLVNPSGTKLFYKVVGKNEAVRYESLTIVSLDTKVLEEDLIISGDIIEFMDDEHVVVYGVDINDKKSGLYNLNITDGDFKLINQISNAFIDYVKVIDDNRILFIQSSLEQGRKTYIYKIDDGDLKLVTDKIKRVGEVCFYDEVLYFTGELEDSRFSLYSLNLNSKEVKRLVYDFPRVVTENSKLIFNDNKVFFVGYQNDEYNANIYIYDIVSKSTRVLDEKDSEYRIINESR